MAFAKVLKWLAAWLTEGLEDLVEVLVVMVVKVVAEEVPRWRWWPRRCFPSALLQVPVPAP